MLVAFKLTLFSQPWTSAGVYFVAFFLATNFIGTIGTQYCKADETAIYEADDFVKKIKPILADHCFDCHADGADEGGVSFDDLFESKDKELLQKTWHRVLKQVRADLMPPIDELQPSDEQSKQLQSWIIRQPLGLDPENLNPGSLTIRRLNRIEYRNTIRALLDVDYNTTMKFPADDTGHGFDNIGDVLSISPLLLEKYFNAANDIVSSVVPTTSQIFPEKKIPGQSFKQDPANAGNVNSRGHLELSYYKAATAKAEFETSIAGDYQLNLNLSASEDYVDLVFDLNECEFRFVFDGEELLKRKFVRQNGKGFRYVFDRKLKPGKHTLEVSIKPTTKKEQLRRLRLVLSSVIVRGPMANEHRVKPDGYDRFFPRDTPNEPKAKREYAKELLGDFAKRAYRRPVQETTLTRLADLAEYTYNQDGETFESGISKGMTAILASPQFVFREEFTLPGDDSKFPLIDEYSLASRLSYFLWSSMPDEELIGLADRGELRKNLDGQLARMMADERFGNFVENFAGQWLQARSVESVPIDSRAVAWRDAPPDPEADKIRDRFIELFRKGSDRTDEEEKEVEEARPLIKKIFRQPKIKLDNNVRRAMRRETEMTVEHIIKGNRSLLELVDSNYTFLNQSLAKFYGIAGVKGRQMRRYELPDDSVRGGVLTQGTMLVVTSNPNRTSPVKRGLFVLENLLGTPTSAPPPDIPALEEVEESSDKKLSLRESLEIHRKDPNCSSCHNRMDPLGLALENFNAMGRFRTDEYGQRIESKGVLITGEPFKNVTELKKILATKRKTDFYRCLTEKMLTYALGRALEYEDILTVDDIVIKLELNDGKANELLGGIVKSAAFQRTAKPNLVEAIDQDKDK